MNVMPAFLQNKLRAKKAYKSNEIFSNVMFKNFTYVSAQEKK